MQWSWELNSPIPIRVSSLVRKDVDVHLCRVLLHWVQFTLIHGPNILGSYAVLFSTTSDFTFSTRHISTSFNIDYRIFRSFHSISLKSHWFFLAFVVVFFFLIKCHAFLYRPLPSFLEPFPSFQICFPVLPFCRFSQLMRVMCFWTT